MIRPFIFSTTFMTSSLRTKIKQADGLLDALRVLESEHASGALIVKAGDSEGSIAFIEARIVGAAVSPTGERGEEALLKLADFKNTPVKLRYSKFYGMHSSGKVADIPIVDYVDQISGHDSHAAERDSQSLISPLPEPAAIPFADERSPAHSDVIETPITPAPIDVVQAVAPTPLPPRRKVPTGPLVAVTAIALLAGATIWIPAQIKSTAGGGTVEDRAIQRLKKSLHETLASDTPQELGVLIPNRKHKPPPKPGDIIAEEPKTEDLRFARYLVNKGKIEEARQYYESYVRMFPNTIKPRLELINVYLATNHRPEARLLCLRTFKKQLTSDEIGSVWQLLGQCQTD
jgi:hypothetical protein